MKTGWTGKGHAHSRTTYCFSGLGHEAMDPLAFAIAEPYFKNLECGLSGINGSERN